METILERIFDDVVSEFQISSRDAVEICERIGKGYSGAEVYRVELKAPSLNKGFYFLKIDSDPQEYDNINKGFCFSKVAKCIKYKKIAGYHVLLLEIAGKSSREYMNFYKVHKPKIKEKAVAGIVPELLWEGADREHVIRDAVPSSRIFAAQLQHKLSGEGVLAEYLGRMFAGKDPAEVIAVRFGEAILPNAFAYAVKDELWCGNNLRDTMCCIHGDLHGDNVFVSKKNTEYILIDMSSYRENGYVFYDTAYFELSVLLHNLAQESMEGWCYTIMNIAAGDWEDVDCKDKGVIQEIASRENDFIQELNGDHYSYIDELNEARLVARVLAGLNYAGKGKVTEEIRRKAYVFACYYLKHILERKSISYISSDYPICAWQEVQEGEDERARAELRRFLQFAGQFDGSQRYLLTVGDQWNYPEAVGRNLSRIRWSGVVSFRSEAGFEKDLGRNQLVRYMEPTDNKTLDTVSQGNLWWLYANGLKANTETQKEGFAKWRNNYNKFFIEFGERVGTALAPDEIMVILDWQSFRHITPQYVNKMLEYLDVIENTGVNVAVLDKFVDFALKKEDYENVKIERFKIGLEDIAEYCSQYMPGVPETSIYIPNRQSRMGVCLGKEDQQYIEQYLELVHEQLVKLDCALEDGEKYKFFYGEPITWTAIDEELYVNRPEIEDYKNKVTDEISNSDRNQIVLRVPHTPGAGASILCRIICWKLKNDYPTILLSGRMNENTYESLRRLSSISGKHLLILMDSDYNQNDVNQLLTKLAVQRIKACILYPHRVYQGSDEVETLSALTYDEGTNFKNEYAKRMRESKQYSEEECEKRIQRMELLTSDQSLIEFRLPFFYGMHAFEEDYKGISEYLEAIFDKMNKRPEIEKVVSYMALISYYTESRGLSFKYAEKILGFHEKSGRKLLEKLSWEFPNLIYISTSSYRICHPIVALKILQNRFHKFDSEAYKNFCAGFIKDLRSYEPGELISERFQELMMDMFIKRDTEGDIKDNLKKKNFSKLIIDIDNSNLQEQIFETLVEAMPKAPHFRQHYGRLIISNDPLQLDKAREQFNAAIDLDGTNGIHYHSRGDMYTKYVIYQCNNKYKDLESRELFDKLRTFVDSAMKDYKRSIELEKRNNNAVDLVYPYASIIQTSTYIVTQLCNRSGYRENVEEFLWQTSEMSRWCQNLIATAIQYDMDTEYRYDGIRENDFYKKTRTYLIKYRYSRKQLEQKIRKEPKNLDLKKVYLGAMDSTKEGWEKKTADELVNIVTYSEELMQGSHECPEGVLWKWFNANIHLKGREERSYTKLLGILETMLDLETNLSGNFFLSILYFCKFMQSKDEGFINKMQDCVELCRQLSKDSGSRTATRYYYTGKGGIPLAFDREDSFWFDGTVLKFESNQSGYLTLDINPKLKAFFVPVYTDLRKGQEFNQPVQVKIGFSFDGLRAWEMKRLREPEK